MSKMPEKSKPLREKYTPEMCNKVRQEFDDDVQAWSKIRNQAALDVQCITTGSDDPTDVAGPWPPQEWAARHAKGQERPCLHEDILTQYVNQVVNPIEMNPMGIEVAPAGDGANEKTAEFIEGRIRQWEYEHNGQLAYIGAAREAATRSYGFWKNELYYRKGFSRKLCIEPVADPDSIVPGFHKKLDWSDMRRCWELDRMTHEAFREKYPNAAMKDFGGINEVAPQWCDDKTIQVAAWWHFDVDERELLYMDLGDDQNAGVEVYADEVPNDFDNSKILNRRKVRQKKVVKTIFNGVEALEETEWVDPGDEEEGVEPEIPIYVVTGRAKYEDGQLCLESVVRKGRVGQLLYDYLISAIQETIALTPRVVRTGAEGSFDTSTDWNPRSIVAFKEWKPTVNPETGQANPPPVVEMYQPPIQALEIAKQSILIGIQNAIGMSSTERQDRTAKSGKALDQLKQDMSIASSHYFSATRIQQERQYRAALRIFKVIENEPRKVAIRDKFGKHSMVDMDPSVVYGGRHAVTVGTGKLYQNLQEKQEDFAEELTKIGDPLALMVALPGICKMKGVGPYGDELAEVFERVLIKLHPELADLYPEAQQAASQGQNPQVMLQQAHQAVQALNAHAQQIEGQLQQLKQERDAKILDIQARASEGDKDRKNKIEIAEINASTKERMDGLDAQLASLKHVADVLSGQIDLNHDAIQNGLDRQHALTLQQSQQDAAALSQQSAQQASADQQAQQQQEQPAASTATE